MGVHIRAACEVPLARDAAWVPPPDEELSDDDMDEPEEDENAIIEFDGPIDEEDREEEIDVFARVPGIEEPAVAAALDDEEIEAGIDDDMEGALEGNFPCPHTRLATHFSIAIGLRGPMQPVLQNVSAPSVLLRFVLTSAMDMGVL